MMTPGLRVAGVVTGVVSAAVATLFMMMGAWGAEPSLPNLSLIASCCYPLLLLSASGALARSARTGFWLAVLGIGCAILTVTPYAMDITVPRTETLAVGVLVCLPGVMLAVVAWALMRSVALSRRPLMRR